MFVPGPGGRPTTSRRTTTTATAPRVVELPRRGRTGRVPTEDTAAAGDLGMLLMMMMLMRRSTELRHKDSVGCRRSVVGADAVGSMIQSRRSNPGRRMTTATRRRRRTILQIGIVLQGTLRSGRGDLDGIVMGSIALHSRVFRKTAAGRHGAFRFRRLGLGGILTRMMRMSVRMIPGTGRTRLTVVTAVAVTVVHRFTSGGLTVAAQSYESLVVWFTVR